MIDQTFAQLRRFPMILAAIVWLATSAVACGASAHTAPPAENPRQPAPPPASPPASPPAPAPKEPAAAPARPTQPLDLPPVDPKWLDRLPKDDREAIDVLRGYAPPPLADDLQWLSSERLDWMRFRGKVVVVQSWTTANTAGRGWPARIVNALKEIDAGEFQILALHTPDKAEGAEEFMKKQKPPEGVVVAIDPSGVTCDSLGIYKQPVNFIVDKNGVVRYAGLNLNGLKNAVAELVKEPFDRKVTPPERAAEEPDKTAPSGVEYPPIKGSVRGAADWRGKRGPDFVFESWYTNQINLAGQVAIVTFWKVDEPASLGTHGQLNDLQSRFAGRAAIIVISGDSRSSFEEEAAERQMNKSDFSYGVALDRNHKMAAAMNVTAFPYTIVLGKDWMVRWQGHPGALTPAIIQQTIDADAASVPAPAPEAPSKRRGWVQS